MITLLEERRRMNDDGVQVYLTTGRTLRQGSSMESGKLTREYQDAVAVCEMDETSLDALGVVDSGLVRLESEYGSVVVKAKLNRRASAGIVFVPCGPYANVVLGPDTGESGMPEFKGLLCRVFAAQGEQILSPSELLLQMASGDA